MISSSTICANGSESAFCMASSVRLYFNVLNRANRQVPNNIITSPTFGQPTAVNDPRQLQFGLRVLF